MNTPKVGDSVKLSLKINEVFSDGSFYAGVPGTGLFLKTKSSCIIEHIPKLYEPKIGDVVINRCNFLEYVIKAIEDNQAWTKRVDGTYFTVGLDSLQSPKHYTLKEE